ncbi:adenylate kinase [Enterococcus sp. DIV0660C]|uniref:adenylate kinase n=1 Tax=Enterococcus sp. DIV0660C TaxID=2230880 RepID=UPI001A8EACED|nr:adenylate kinase [Enterococcus sp. DIV0660C]MBO0432136.1 adenylate kinase [Enterococcus sp. DIV0660C]
MIILISGASHTGKTLLSQKLLEKVNYPYLSLDHLKMGLIRSDSTKLTVEDDKVMTEYLWNITKEIIKTAIENKQNLIIEGVYIPFNWKDSFDDSYLSSIKHYCLILSQDYIKKNFSEIKKYASTIEQRIDDSYCTSSSTLEDNIFNLEMCKKFKCNYILIDTTYNIQKIVDKIQF